MLISAYVAWTGKYRTGDFSVQRSSALFYPQGSATYSQGDPVNNSGAGGDGTNSVKTGLTFKASNQSNYYTIANLPDQTFQDEATLTRLAQAAFSFPTSTVVEYRTKQVPGGSFGSGRSGGTQEPGKDAPASPANGGSPCESCKRTWSSWAQGWGAARPPGRPCAGGAG